MKMILPITFALGCLLALPISSRAQSRDAAKTHMSRGELKNLQREANAPEQFKLLADYYQRREALFAAKAAGQKAEWERRAKNVNGPNARPPRPVDSARNLYEYYQYEADQAGGLARQYERRAAKKAAPEGGAA